MFFLQALQLLPRKQLPEVEVDVVHHEEQVVERGLVGWVLQRNDHVEQSRGKHVLRHLGELPHNRNFSQNLLGVVAIVEDLFDSLNGHNSASFDILSLDHDSEATLSEVFE